jgi:TP901 family phage tail tape measure protein
VAMNVSIAIKLLDNVTGPIRRVQQAVASAHRGIEATKERSDKAFERADRIKQSGDAIARFAEKSRAAVESIVTPFEDFEEAMSRVKALTGTSGEDFEKMTEQARKLGASGRFSALDAARGMEALRIQGFNASEVMAALPKVMDAAIVSNTSLDAVIGTTADTMDAFGLGASEMGRVLDVTTATALAAGTPIAAMTAALSGSGNAAVEAGISFERMAQLAGLLATKHIEGGQAAGTLEKMMKTLVHPTGDAAKILKILGVSTTETVNGVKKMRDPLEIVTDLQDKMTKRGVSATNQMTAMTAMFERSALDVMTLARAAREPGMEQLSQAIAGATGKTGELAKQMKDNGAEASRDLNAAMQELRNTLAQSMAPVIERSVKSMTELVRSVIAWTQAHPKLTEALGLGLIAVAKIATAMAALFTIVGAAAATKGMLILANGYLGFGKVLGPLASIIPGAIKMLIGLASATWAAVAPALAAAAPFIAMAAAVGAVTLAVVQLQKAWGTLDFGESFKGFKEALGDGSVFKTMTLNPFSGLSEGAQTGLSDPSSLLSPSSQAADATLRPQEAPRGLIEVKIDSEGRPSVKPPKASGGIDLDVSAGLLMSAG